MKSDMPLNTSKYAMDLVRTVERDKMLAQYMKAVYDNTKKFKNVIDNVKARCSRYQVAFYKN